MRRSDATQHVIFSYRTLEERILANHTHTGLRVLVDGLLAAMHARFEQPDSPPRHPA